MIASGHADRMGREQYPMASEIVVISPETHKNTKIKTNGTLEFSADMNIVPVVMPEFANVAASGPIVFVRDAGDTRFVAAALLGFEQGENLFFHDMAWQGTHVPMNIGRVPFTLKRVEDSQTVSPALDMSHELVNEEEGEALMNEQGEETEYFKRVNNFLGTLFDGEIASQKFAKALQDNDLLQEFKVYIEQADGRVRELTGLWTPNITKLQQLADGKVLEFHKEGFLAAAHIVIQSMTQMTRLVKMKNEQAGQIAVKSVRIEIIDPNASVVKS